MASTRKENLKAAIKPNKGQQSISAFFAAVPKKVSDGRNKRLDTLQLSPVASNNFTVMELSYLKLVFVTRVQIAPGANTALDGFTFLS